MSKGSLQLQLDSLNSVDKEFYKFLKDSDNSFIRIDGCDVVNGCWTTKTISGLHRWKTAYKKRIYAKLCQLNPWYEKHHLPITMVTFTTRQRGLSIHDQVDLLKHSFNKAKKLLNKYLGKFPYFWVMEPHKSGYGHIHMLIFKHVPRSIRYSLAETWSSTYGAGGYKRALTFSMSKSQHSLRSAGAYVFKYIEKTLDYDLLSHPDSGYFKLSSWVWKMSRHDNEYTGVRFWGCSRDLSEVMSYSGDVDTNTIWWRVNIWHDADSERGYKAGWFPHWIDDDMAAYPDRVHDFDRWLASCGGGYPENLS